MRAAPVSDGGGGLAVEGSADSWLKVIDLRKTTRSDKMLIPRQYRDLVVKKGVAEVRQSKKFSRIRCLAAVFAYNFRNYSLCDHCNNDWTFGMTDTFISKRSVAELPWLRNSIFDGMFIFGLISLSIVTGAVILYEPSLFFPILVIDLWFLGYHHVISTYTRICFDKGTFQEHKFLLVGLLPAVVIGTLGIVWIFGVWTVVSIYFYWQWWHYTRHSWGISRAYRGKDRDAAYEDGWLDQAVFYSIPVFGILNRSAEQHPTFIGLELWSFPVPPIVADACGYVAVALFSYWVFARIMAAFQGRLAIDHTMYMATHFIIFWLTYIAIGDITIGWLMINIWHYAQYILFVWMYNNERFVSGFDPNTPFLSYISQNGRMWLYMLTCVAITGVIYWGFLRSIDLLFFAGLSATIVLYQIVNFHHYVVDSMIWKMRTPKMRSTREINHDV